MVSSAEPPTIDARTSGDQRAAELFVERGQRDVPEFFGVDEGAVHVEQHRLHDTDSVMGLP